MAPPVSDLVVLAGAVVRLAHLATKDDLPPVAKARRRASDWLGHRLGLEWAEGPYCAWCVSPYLGAAVTAGYAAAGRRSPAAKDRYLLALLPLALSAAAGWVAEREAT